MWSHRQAAEVEGWWLCGGGASFLGLRVLGGKTPAASLLFPASSVAASLPRNHRIYIREFFPKRHTFNLTYQIYLLKIYFFLSPNFIFFNPVFWYSTSNSIHYCCFSYFIIKVSFVPFIIFMLCLHCYNTVLKFYSRQDQFTPLNITASLWMTLQLLFICHICLCVVMFSFSNRIKYETLI